MRGRGTGFAAWILCCSAMVTMPALAGSAQKTPTVQTLLQRMSHALEALNYEGTFVYLHEGDLEAMHVVHRVDAQGGEERLYSLTGAPREIIRKHKSVVCILPRKRLVVVEKYQPDTRFPIVLARAPNAVDLSHYYKFSRLGHQRTAGHDCVVVALQPKDHYRYGYRLWLDAGTSMLLRSELVDDQGQTIERIMFTQFDLPENIPASALHAQTDTTGFTHRKRGDRASPAAGPHLRVHVDKLPPGYAITVDESQHLAGIAAPVRHLVFTDGLASLSVFAAPLKPGKDVLHGASRMGSVNAFGRVLQNYQITVVGEVPAETVKLVAQSVRIETPPVARRPVPGTR